MVVQTDSRVSPAVVFVIGVGWSGLGRTGCLLRTHMAKKTAYPSPERLPQPSAEGARLNCIIPADPHKRVKVGCANEGVSITDVVVELLEGRFPKR